MRRVAAVLLLAGSLAACDRGSPVGDELPALAPPEGDPGLVHIHGLGINPADEHLYIATHFGLWRLAGEDDLSRVGDAYHDLMGFTVVGPDHFLASGHPVLVEDRLPPNLGLIETTDAGRTWRSVSLLGAVDFHALRHAHDSIYGWDATSGTLMVSADGEDWERRGQAMLLDFAVDPQDAGHLVGAQADGLDELSLVRSDDGGRTWSPLDGPAGRLSWAAPERLWVVDRNGGVWHSGDAAASWEQRGSLPGPPEAVYDAGDRLYAAAGGQLLASDDGVDWQVLHSTH